MTPSIEERRRVAAKLREKIGRSLFTGIDVEECMGEEGWSVGIDDGARSYMHLADLIDPKCWARTVEDNLAMIERNRELRCGICRERWSRMWDANGRVDILGASVCTVEEGQRCGRWREREDG